MIKTKLIFKLYLRSFTYDAHRVVQITRNDKYIGYIHILLVYCIYCERFVLFKCVSVLSLSFKNKCNGVDVKNYIYTFKINRISLRDKNVICTL